MEKEKINVAEILLDSPKNAVLYSPLLGHVYLDRVREIAKGLRWTKQYVIDVFTDRRLWWTKSFMANGKFATDMRCDECMLFPSKTNRDWSNFRPLVFEDLQAGTIVMCLHAKERKWIRQIYLGKGRTRDFETGLETYWNRIVLPKDLKPSYKYWYPDNHLDYSFFREKSYYDLNNGYAEKIRNAELVFSNTPKCELISELEVDEPQKTNVAMLLKNKERGTRLYSPAFGEVSLFDVCEIHSPYDNEPRHHIIIGNAGGAQFFDLEILDQFGRYFGGEDCECVLFPSISCRTWADYK